MKVPGLCQAIKRYGFAVVQDPNGCRESDFNIRDYIRGISSDIPAVEALWRPMLDDPLEAGFPE